MRVLLLLLIRYIDLAGFSSLFLYRRWYRCNVNLSHFGVDGQMIDKRHGLSLEEFVSNYDGMKPVHPVCFRDFFDHI